MRQAGSDDKLDDALARNNKARNTLFINTAARYDQRVRRHRRFRVLSLAVFAGALWLSAGAGAQQTPEGIDPPFPPAIQQGHNVQNPTGACVQPPPQVSWQDYNGPFSKALGSIGQ